VCRKEPEVTSAVCREELDVIVQCAENYRWSECSVYRKAYSEVCRKESELLVEEKEVKVYSKGPTVKVQC